ncbi:unnamed protein product [Symbiodinium microadriaticum]|nr:unnamed protein product [Symbiodinium microadriaticum]
MRDVFNHDTRDKAAKEEMAELRSGEEEAGRSEEEQICPLRQEEEQMRALSDENLAKKRAVKRELVLARRESARLREEHAAAELRVQEQTSDVRAVLRVYSGEANVKSDVTRHRYGDDAHLDSSLKALGLVGSGGRYPKMLKIIESKAPRTITACDRFFGPGIWTEADSLRLFVCKPMLLVMDECMSVPMECTAAHALHLDTVVLLEDERQHGQEQQLPQQTTAAGEASARKRSLRSPLEPGMGPSLPL